MQPRFPDGHERFINFVVDQYGQLSALELSALTHNEGPWRMTLPNEVISNEAISAYYLNHPFAANFPLTDAKPFRTIETDADWAFGLDMSRKDAARFLVYRSFTEYQAEWKLAVSQAGILTQSRSLD